MITLAPGLVLPTRYQHNAIYMLGRTGVGKSNLLGSIALQCHAQGEGVVVVDTKDGALARQLARITPYPDKTILVSPGTCYFDHQWHYWGLNVMAYERHYEEEEAADNIATRILDMFERTGDLQGNFTQVRKHLTFGGRLALARPSSTLVDLRKVLTEPGYRKFIRDNFQTLPEVRFYWDRFDRAFASAYQQEKEIASTIPRIAEYITAPIFNFTVGQEKTTIRLQEWLDEGYLVLFDLATKMEWRYSILFGNLIMALIMQAAAGRPSVDEEPSLRHWWICLDEFHRIAPFGYPDLVNLLRSRNIWPIFAHQHRGQLSQGSARENSILESLATITTNIFFKPSTEDETYLRKSRPRIGDDLINFKTEDHYAYIEASDCPEGYGFPDIGQVQKLKGRTSKEEQRAQLDKLIAKQHAFTRPRSELAEEHRRRYYAEDQEEPVQTRSKRQDKAPVDDSAGKRSPATAGRTAFSRKRPG